jgi:hypothetical protein
MNDIKKAIEVARKKIRILSPKALNQNLSFACDDMADAFRCGVEEAQMEILDRLLAIEAKAALGNENGGEPK